MNVRLLFSARYVRQLTQLPHTLRRYDSQGPAVKLTYVLSCHISDFQAPLALGGFTGKLSQLRGCGGGVTLYDVILRTTDPVMQIYTRALGRNQGYYQVTYISVRYVNGYLYVFHMTGSIYSYSARNSGWVFVWYLRCRDLFHLDDIVYLALKALNLKTPAVETPFIRRCKILHPQGPLTFQGLIHEVTEVWRGGYIEGAFQVVGTPTLSVMQDGGSARGRY